jgi:hypothetical protein
MLAFAPEETAEPAMKRALIGATAIMIAGLVLGSAAVFGVLAPANTANTPAIEPVWTEAKWPFPMDQWGLGKAFVCSAADCGAQVNVYVRPKIGSAIAPPGSPTRPSWKGSLTPSCCA